ncbi:Protein saf4 [Coemansia sp. Benny D115]|nr:Protein saf4 [Coemansia sp. Benny D115]
MAERRATNKYYPPDWDPSKGSVNTYLGQHPLRQRARKFEQEGILTVRFELPYSIWCTACQELKATGQRFNAEKKKIGSYYSTPIWSFRMKCNTCQSWFEIHTNPQQTTYEVVSGARKKELPSGDKQDTEESTSPIDQEIIDLTASINTGQNANDGLRRLELERLKKQRAQQMADRLRSLQSSSDRQWRDADASNSRLRDIFRQGRRKRDRDREESAEIQKRLGISLPVLPAHSSDSLVASATQFGDGRRRKKTDKHACLGQPMFRSSGAGGAKGKQVSLKSRIALQSLANADPFASGSVGRFAGPVQKLGIQTSCSSTRESMDERKYVDGANALTELATSYCSDSSSSSPGPKDQDKDADT